MIITCLQTFRDYSYVNQPINVRITIWREITKKDQSVFRHAPRKQLCIGSRRTLKSKEDEHIYIHILLIK